MKYIFSSQVHTLYIVVRKEGRKRERKWREIVREKERKNDKKTNKNKCHEKNKWMINYHTHHSMLWVSLSALRGPLSDCGRKIEREEKEKEKRKRREDEKERKKMRKLIMIQGLGISFKSDQEKLIMMTK